MKWFDRIWTIWSGLRRGNKTSIILFLGLDNAGKTTLLHQLAYEKLQVHPLTSTPNIEVLRLYGTNMKAIDVSGYSKDAAMWKDYFAHVDGVIFVVDAAQPARFQEVKKEIQYHLESIPLRSIPFAILGNKIDEVGAAGEAELVGELVIADKVTGKGAVVSKDSGVRPMEVFMCSLVKKVGYEEAFRWLSRHL